MPCLLANYLAYPDLVTLYSTCTRFRHVYQEAGGHTHFLSQLLHLATSHLYMTCFTHTVQTLSLASTLTTPQNLPCRIRLVVQHGFLASLVQVVRLLPPRLHTLHLTFVALRDPSVDGHLRQLLKCLPSGLNTLILHANTQTRFRLYTPFAYPQRLVSLDFQLNAFGGGFSFYYETFTDLPASIQHLRISYFNINDELFDIHLKTVIQDTMHDEIAAGTVDFLMQLHLHRTLRRAQVKHKKTSLLRWAKFTGITIAFIWTASSISSIPFWLLRRGPQR